jgi:hypothetical protein
MGLPAAVLQALVPRSPSSAPPERPHRTAPEVDRFTSGEDGVRPEAVVTDLRSLAARHQAQQAARTAQAA